jgi:hypothetical protein
LEQALLQRLDVDGDRRLSADELQSASNVLFRLDVDDNELIDPDELVPRVVYPGAAGSMHCSGNSKIDSRAGDGPWFLLLPQDRNDAAWAQTTLQRLDRDGDGRLAAGEARIQAQEFKKLDVDNDDALTSAELAGWRQLSPIAWCRLRLGRREPAKPLFEAETPAGSSALSEAMEWRMGSCWLSLWGEEQAPSGRTGDGPRRRLQLLFASKDKNGDGSVDENEAAGGELLTLLEDFDKNSDRKLTLAELTDWMELQESLLRGSVLWTVLDHGSGLFEFLDDNHDGRLSVVELQTARDRAQNAGLWTSDGFYDPSRTPRRLLTRVGQGTAHPSCIRRRYAGPEWWRAMDANADGEVSPREFAGPLHAFRRLDLNANRSLDSREAVGVSPRRP